MRLRRLVVPFAPALLAAGILTPSAGAATCASAHPKPRISLTGSRTRAIPAETPRLAFGGYLKRDGCALVGQAVGLFVRTGPGPYVFATKTVTGAYGKYNATLPFRGEMDVIAIFSGDRQEARAVSQVWHVYVGRQPEWEFGFGGQCSYSRLDGPRYNGPSGVQVTSVGVPPNVSSAADHIAFTVRVTNSSTSSFTFTPERNDWFGNPAVLENVATGEQLSFTRSSDALIGPSAVTLQPGASIDFDRWAELRICQTPHTSHKHIAAARFRLHGAALVHMEDGRTLSWFAPPVEVSVLGV